MSTTDAVLVLTTVADDAFADELARTLVDERLAACVNLHAPMISVYRWKGAVERDAERQVVIKTVRSRLHAALARIRELHRYELPEILVIDVAAGSDMYLEWLQGSVQL